MDAIIYKDVRANLVQTMGRICAEDQALILTRNDPPCVVVMSQADFKALEQTADLLRSPKHAGLSCRPSESWEQVRGKRKSCTNDADLCQKSLGG